MQRNTKIVLTAVVVGILINTILTLTLQVAPDGSPNFDVSQASAMLEHKMVLVTSSVIVGSIVAASTYAGLQYNK